MAGQAEKGTQAERIVTDIATAPFMTNERSKVRQSKVTSNKSTWPSTPPEPAKPLPKPCLNRQPQSFQSHSLCLGQRVESSDSTPTAGVQ